MATTTLSSQIYSSRDAIITQITEYLRTYLELENVTLVKGSFLSFLVETLATLTSNLIFYESSVYNEFFLTKAKLDESVFNLAAFLGYNTAEASYATANVLVTIPLTFTGNNITITMAEGFKFLAQNIPFLTYYDTVISVTNNSQVSITVTEENRVYNLPVIVDTTAEQEFRFILPVRQYENTIQEFQIDSDLQPYQFTNIDVPLTGKVSTMEVEIKDPNGSSWRDYTGYNSTYLTDSDDYGYVSRRTDFGRRLYFGNGLIGVQPLPGSTVRVTVQETLGQDGNVIAGSINIGNRLYTVDNNITKIVNYEVINTSPAVNGNDEESIEEIRRNAINNLTSLGRLVSENDYINANVVMPNSPITENSLPVLKRSDVRVNEVQLYVNLLYNNNIVPMRNAQTTYPITTTYVPRGSTVTVDSEEYYTLFDMSIDSTTNESAYYNYILNELTQVPSLVRTYVPPANQDLYDIIATQLRVYRSGSSGIFELSYTSTENDYALTDCEMSILSSGISYTMTNDSVNRKFIYTFTNYTDIPANEQTFYFTLSDSLGNNVSRYSNILTFRRSLNSFMLSNIDSDGTNVTVYDIPVIQKVYYDSTAVVQTDFETQVLQSMLTNMDFINYRMLTDFVNLKFTNTTGKMNNMLLNETTKLPVIDISELPSTANVGDRYIVAECSTQADTYKNQIAQATAVDGTASITWSFTEPTSNDIIYVTSRARRYLYTGSEWILPIYDIPLQLTLEVFKTETYSGSDVELTNAVRSDLISSYSSRFGSNAEIHRSEIIRTVQSVDGVAYCTLLTPQSSIYFNFCFENLTEAQLLPYGPEYVYFTTGSISVRILTT